jgi:murein DD-endopeptidase MepM/ murein hydrolase activator NlpD
VRTLKIGDIESNGRGPIHGAQWVLSGHNVFKENFEPGGIDGDFGEETGEACVRAKEALGFPAAAAAAPTFGPHLRAYLLGEKSLPVSYTARRLLRQKRRSESKFIYPAKKKVAIIGRPGQGTHSFTAEPNNWQSDAAWDFAFKSGTPLLAVADGVIGPQLGPISTDPNSRFGGLRCYLVTDDNEFYYAHLSRFAPETIPGARFTQGQALGFSGSASGVDHLHMGVRDWRAFQATAEG